MFVIDTSGSMQNFNWQLMLRTLNEVLDIYPHVKGMQVMNDEGYYMFTAYAGEWMDDTPARRKAIVERARNWTPFSNWSLVEDSGGNLDLRVAGQESQRVCLR